MIQCGARPRSRPCGKRPARGRDRRSPPASSRAAVRPRRSRRRPLQHLDLALLGAELSAHAGNLVPHPIEFHTVLRSSGTSLNFRISLASLKSPLDGSPVREKAIAPACPGLRDSASARMTAALALKHSARQSHKSNVLNHAHVFGVFGSVGAVGPCCGGARAAAAGGERS